MIPISPQNIFLFIAALGVVLPWGTATLARLLGHAEPALPLGAQHAGVMLPVLFAAPFLILAALTWRWLTSRLRRDLLGLDASGHAAWPDPVQAALIGAVQALVVVTVWEHWQVWAGEPGLDWPILAPERFLNLAGGYALAGGVIGLVAGVFANRLLARR